MSPNKQFVKIVGTRGETHEEECKADFNVDRGSEVKCSLKSKLYVGTVTCVEWRIDGDDGLGLSQVCYITVHNCTVHIAGPLNL